MCSSMKIFSLNVRGLGVVKKRRSVWECVSKYNPTVVIIQETKKDDMNAKLVNSSVGSILSEWCALPAVGTSRGILIVWDPVEVKKVDEIIGNLSFSIKMVELSSGFE